ncbi:predicted protein [Botrytis cinerea T4]|uniref:Uncharacterized protein n=1 Tax=Botryotinia fuckeliana (strain T4) TaxID=999810 RepID=G2YE77_BOTF4|nr:predicted protein [Botrytis cinerea T4]
MLPADFPKKNSTASTGDQFSWGVGLEVWACALQQRG